MSATVASLTPHRYPMLLLDRLDVEVDGRRGRAVKVVSVGESYHEQESGGGLPGTLVVDALGQLAIAVLSSPGTAPPAIWYLAGLESITFGRPILPGDTLQMEAEVTKTWRGTSRVAVRASVEGAVRVSGLMVLAAGSRKEGVAR